MQGVSVFNAHPRYRIARKDVERYVLQALGRRQAHISVVCIDSYRCKAINRKFLNHDCVTDVISFTIEEAPALGGEIYVNLDRAKQQAKEYGVTFANEIARLVIHGVLHVIGYDDATAAQKKQMRALEDKHVRRIFPD